MDNNVKALLIEKKKEEIYEFIDSVLNDWEKNNPISLDAFGYDLYWALVEVRKNWKLLTNNEEY